MKLSALICSIPALFFIAATAGAARPALAQAVPDQCPVTHSALALRLGRIAARAGGSTGVALVHVETGRAAMARGGQQMPLYSVFKLPLAVTVLAAIERGDLRLEQTVRVNPADVVPGWQGNSDLWRRPVDVTLRDLLNHSMVRSDNTSSDKLLHLVGGPGAVTRQMRRLGFSHIRIDSTIRGWQGKTRHPNTGSAGDLARLLAALDSGKILKPAGRELLLGFMRRTTTGARRLRGKLPPDVEAMDKSGTGENPSVTNDAGLVRLPGGRGTLALVVFIEGSELDGRAQEDIIAEVARAAYDTYMELPPASL